MPKIIADRISIDHFIRSNDGYCFIAEASALSPSVNPLSQLYDDACDAGFVLVSTRTGCEVPFLYSHVDRNEGEVAGWNFIVEPYFLRTHPSFASVRALIIND